MAKTTVAQVDARTTALQVEVASLSEQVAELVARLDAQAMAHAEAEVTPTPRPSTRGGVNCGRCSKGREKVKHASVAEVKACYAR